MDCSCFVATLTNACFAALLLLTPPSWAWVFTSSLDDQSADDSSTPHVSILNQVSNRYSVVSDRLTSYRQDSWFTPVFRLIYFYRRIAWSSVDISWSVVLILPVFWKLKWKEYRCIYRRRRLERESSSYDGMHPNPISLNPSWKLPAGSTLYRRTFSFPT